MGECSTKSGQAALAWNCGYHRRNILQLVIEDRGSGLQQQVCAAERPVHLLFLDELPVSDCHEFIDSLHAI
jgi:hypothetical protein